VTSTIDAESKLTRKHPSFGGGGLSGIVCRNFFACELQAFLIKRESSIASGYYYEVEYAGFGQQQWSVTIRSEPMPIYGHTGEDPWCRFVLQRRGDELSLSSGPWRAVTNVGCGNPNFVLRRLLQQIWTEAQQHIWEPRTRPKVDKQTSPVSMLCFWVLADPSTPSCPY
jgi:hypothetical protein